MNDPKKFNAGVAFKTLRVREIFFDFEGTMVSFQWRLPPAVDECLRALAKAGFKTKWYGSSPSYDHLYNHSIDLDLQGKGNDDPSPAAAIVGNIYDKYDADALTRWSLYPDTLHVLEILKKQGFRMGIISNVGKATLGNAMDRLDLTGLVEVVISRNDVKRIKPYPDGLIKAAEILEVDPAHSIFIGDGRNDVAAAREAGMLAGYIRGGEDSPEAMAQFPVDLEIDNLGQLPLFLDRIAP